MDCCTGSICWCFTSNGLNTVSQDEIVFVLRCEADENRIPRDVFHLFKMLYQHAAAGMVIVLCLGLEAVIKGGRGVFCGTSVWISCQVPYYLFPPIIKN